MKKIVCLVLSVIMCLSVLSVGIFADGTTANSKDPVVLSGKSLSDAMFNCPAATATFAYNEENGYSTITGLSDVQNATQAYFNLPNEIDGAEYPIMVVKYRYDKNYAKAGLSIYRKDFTAIDTNHNNAEGLVSNRTADGQIATVADGEWQVAIIDMTKLTFESTKVDLSGGGDRQYLASVGGKTWGDFSYSKVGFVPYGWNSYENSKFDLEYFGFFTSIDEANKYVKGTVGIIFDKLSDFTATNDTTLSDKTDYMNFAYQSGGTTGRIGASFTFGAGFEGSEYKYMAIKYRYESEHTNAAISIFRHGITGTDANNNNYQYTINSRSQDGSIATIDDGQWQTAVIDMTNVSFEPQKYDKTNYPNASVGGGKSWANYTYTTMSILPYGWNRPEAASFDLEYVGFFKTEEDAKEFAGINVYEDNATGYTYDAERLELVYKINASNSINATVKASEDKSYATLTTNQSSGAKAGRLYIPLGEDFDVATQKYFAIKYRYNDNKLLADMQLMRAINSDTTNPLSRVMDGSFTTITGGDGWQTLVVDLTTIEWDNDLFIGKTWAQHELNGIYLMPWGGAATNGANIDIAVLGFSDTENNARAIVGLDPVTESTPNDDTDNAGNNDVTTDKADTTDTVDTESELVTESTDTVAEETKKGCGSSLSYGGAVLIIAIGIAAITVLKKKEYRC